MSAYRTPAPQAAAETEGNVEEKVKTEKVKTDWVGRGLMLLAALGVAAYSYLAYASITGESECRRKHCDAGELAWISHECVCVTRPK